MTDPRTIRWNSIAVESVAIVVSILLAFTIDAWWADKKESDVEHEALHALRADFIASGEQLTFVLQSLASARLEFSRFQSASLAELAEISPDAIRPILTGLAKNHTFDPVTATLDALANDGRLGLISDPQLLTQLSRWRRQLDNTVDISFELRAESLRVRRAMGIHGGPFVRWASPMDGFDNLQRADGEDLADLRRDSDFMSKARSHQYALYVYIKELRKTAEILDSTVALLDRAIAQH